LRPSLIQIRVRQTGVGTLRGAITITYRRQVCGEGRQRDLVRCQYRARARQLFTEVKKEFQVTKLLPKGGNTRTMPCVDPKYGGTVCWIEEMILKDHICTVKNERNTTRNVGGICLARYVLEEGARAEVREHKVNGVTECSHFEARTISMYTGRQRVDVVNKEQDITIAGQVRKGHDRHERCEHFALIDLRLLSTKGINQLRMS